MDHVAFSGASKEAFVYACSAYTVFDRLEKWLKEDDVLCWWGDVPASTLQLLLKAVLKHDYPNKKRILRPYFLAFVSDKKAKKGSPYDLAKSRDIAVPRIEHCSRNDVITVQRLMQGIVFPAAVLNGPVPAKSKAPKGKVPDFLFLYDEQTNLLHVPGSACTENRNDLKGLGTIKSCIAKRYKPCPVCSMETWKKEVKAYNEENVRQRQCEYFFFDDSKVFHRGSCNVILTAARSFSATVYYDTCIGSGRVPCKICKPVPGMFSSRTEKLISVREKKMKECEPEKEIKQEADGAQWMKKRERRAFDRYTQAVKEREAADQENMSAAERKDLFTLTTTSYAFWAARGYSNFHIRTCKKLDGLMNLRGFETFQHAVNAGYQPCRVCKPSKKHNMEISMPFDTQERKNETLEDVLAMCSRMELEYTYQEPVLSIRTSVAEWEINVTTVPVAIDHKPVGENYFHQQHRMFMSLSDAVWYIARHDSGKKQSLEGMLMAMKRKANDK